jgi:hypothetical protein
MTMSGAEHVGAAKICDEMILEGVDGVFDCIAVVEMWWCDLVINILAAQVLL